MKFDKDDLKLGKIERGNARKANTSMVRKAAVHKDKSKFDKAKERQKSRHAKHGIYEADVVNNVRLNDHQKAVLSILLSHKDKPTTLVDLTSNAAETNKQNLTSSLQMLQKMGMVNVSPQSAISVSPKGMQTMATANLADASGQLSPEGQKFVTMFSQQGADAAPDTTDQEMSQSAFGEVPGAAGGPEGQQLPTTELPFGNAPIGGEPTGEQPGDEVNAMVAKKRGSGFGESISLIKSLLAEASYKAELDSFKTA